MRAVVQRVRRARVVVADRECAAISAGLLVYLGVGVDDGDADARYLAEKISGLRIFSDEAGAMNRDVRQAGGGVLVVSAFTVQADARRGRRPSLSPAAPPDPALGLYERFCDALAERDVAVERGTFGAQMLVDAVNDGPVCVLLESRRLF